MENQVQTKTIPEGVKQWNWGAFMFSIFWGFGNRTYWPLLCIIPLFNFIWMFVCGIKENEWAWRNGNYSDVKTFKLVQDTWNRAGLAAFIISLIFIILYFLFFQYLLFFILSVQTTDKFKWDKLLSQCLMIKRNNRQFLLMRKNNPSREGLFCHNIIRGE